MIFYYRTDFCDTTMHWNLRHCVLLPHLSQIWPENLSLINETY